MSSRHHIRGQLVDGLRQTGATVLAAEQIADLAVHAAEQAMVAVFRTCSSLGGNDALSGAIIAYQLAEELARINAEQLIAKLQGLSGVNSTEMNIGRDVPAVAAAGSTQ